MSPWTCWTAGVACASISLYLYQKSREGNDRKLLVLALGFAMVGMVYSWTAIFAFLEGR